MAPKTKETNSKKTQERKEVAVPTRGRIFEGTITKKFATRAVLEFERTIYMKKFERFYKKKTRIHARIPAGMQVEVGEYVRVQECRPLSKIIHHVVIEKLRSVEQKSKQETGDKK